MQKRRSFLKTLPVLGFSALLGQTTAAVSAEPKPRKVEKWDVVVVGAGIAGLSCALRAAELGARVVLLEKMPRPASTTNCSGGWLAATQTKYQSAKDRNEDSIEAFINDMMKVSGYRSDPSLIRAYANEANKAVEWLGDHGVKYRIWKQHYPELARCHIPIPEPGLKPGSQITKVLLNRLAEAKVPVRYSTKAVELIHDDVFNVLGVSCITGDHRTDFMAKGGVVLTTGGFSGNNEMVGRYIGPAVARMVLRGSPYTTGENIIMAQQVNAKMVNMDQYYAGPITPTGHCNPSMLMHAGYGIQLNTQGKRFVNEGLGQIVKARAIAELNPDNMSYLMINLEADRNDNILSKNLKKFRMLQVDVPSGNTIEEAAKNAGLPVENVVQTVKEFNEAVRNNTLDKLTPPYFSPTPAPLEKGPFFMIPAAGGIASTMGGPKIDDHARVVNFENKPIPGLYAAGAAAGGVWYGGDISGSQLGGGLVFGRIAAADASKRAKGE